LLNLYNSVSTESIIDSLFGESLLDIKRQMFKPDSEANKTPQR